MEGGSSRCGIAITHDYGDVVAGPACRFRRALATPPPAGVSQTSSTQVPGLKLKAASLRKKNSKRYRHCGEYEFDD